MKNILICILVTIIVCSSCNTSGMKTINMPAKKYINVVKNVNGYNVAYTEDGHTMLYTNDSIGNYIVYYVKFENGAGKYGLKGIEAKIIRAEMDATLTMLNGFVTVQKGVLCVIDSLMGYKVCFFDEQLKGESLEYINISLDCIQVEVKDVDQEVKRISALLNVAYNIALSISKTNLRGWDNIVYALEPTQDLNTFNAVMISDIYDQRVLKRLPRIQKTAKELTAFYRILRENLIIQNQTSI